MQHPASCSANISRTCGCLIVAARRIIWVHLNNLLLGKATFGYAVRWHDTNNATIGFAGQKRRILVGRSMD